MSTFNGYIKEFPLVTGTSISRSALLKSVDHFTTKSGRPSPRAAFLSHVHKDHMTGLETYMSSFVYCSHATKEVLDMYYLNLTRVSWYSAFKQRETDYYLLKG